MYKLTRNKKLVEPYLEAERVFHQRRREAALLCPIQQVQQNEIVPEEIEANHPTQRAVREVAIPLANNVTSNICRPELNERFELKQNMVQLLHTSEQFMGLSHEDPQGKRKGG